MQTFFFLIHSQCFYIKQWIILCFQGFWDQELWFWYYFNDLWSNHLKGRVNTFFLHYCHKWSEWPYFKDINFLHHTTSTTFISITWAKNMWLVEDREGDFGGARKFDSNAISICLVDITFGRWIHSNSTGVHVKFQVTICYIFDLIAKNPLLPQRRAKHVSPNSLIFNQLTWNLKGKYFGVVWILI